jgi:hypothetical protein
METGLKNIADLRNQSRAVKEKDGDELETVQFIGDSMEGDG